jgi:ribosomal-protein-alanine N-acetyltransferase
LKDLIEISYYDAIQAKNVEEAAKMQAKIDQYYLNGNSIHRGVTDTLNNKIVGTCVYYRSFTNDSCKLGCVLLP